MSKIINLNINLYVREYKSPPEKQYWADLIPHKEKGYIECEVGFTETPEKMIIEIINFLNQEYNLDDRFITDSSIQFYSDLSKSLMSPYWMLGRKVCKHRTLDDTELETIVLGVHKEFIKYIEKQDKKSKK